MTLRAISDRTRQISDRTRQWLVAEMETWQGLNILSKDQADQVLGLYETNAEISQRKRMTAWFALCGVASVMIGAAVLLAVGYNWAAMSSLAKLAVIFSVLFGTHAVAFWLRHQAGRRIVSEIAFLLACLFLGAAIALIGQIFNMHAHYPDAIWLWALCTLPFALSLDTLLLHTLYAGLLAVWVGTEILGFPNNPWFFRYVANGAYSLPVLAAPGLLWAYRKRSPTTVGLYASLLGWWIVLLPIAWRFEVDVLFFILAASALFLLIAELHAVGNPMAKPYRAIGVLLAAIALTPLSFGECLRRMPYECPPGYNYLAATIIALVGVITLLAAMLREHFAGAVENRPRYSVILRRQWMPALLFLLAIGLCLWCAAANRHGSNYNWSHDALKNAIHTAFWATQITAIVVVNVVSLVFAGWLMHLGLQEENTQGFYAGVLYFLLWTVLRYIDLFGEAGGMLGAAAMFFLCGIALFAVARFWIHRKGNQTPETTAPPSPIPSSQPASRWATAWLALVDRVKRHEKALLVIGVACQFLLLASMIASKTTTLLTGETVLLRIVPVDPRDMLHGDYVALSYDFTSIPLGGIAGLPPRNYNKRDDGWNDMTVYVPLASEADGKHWRTQKPVSVTRPTSGKFIRGVIRDNRIECGIEAFYVQEGQGHLYEEAAKRHKLSAEVALDANGDAVLKGLRVDDKPDGQPTFNGPSYDKGVFQYRGPSDTNYHVRRLPHANIKLDGSLSEREWKLANVERHFTFPWEKNRPTPVTEFLAFCDDAFFYFAFRVEDADVFVLDKLRDKQDVIFEDRIEMFLSPDYSAQHYYCLEIDPLGRTYDYEATYYRQFNPKWHCEGLQTAGKRTDTGYVVEGRIPLKTFASLGFSDFQPNQSEYNRTIICGLYRAEFSHDRSGKPAAQDASPHNQGRKLDVPPPLEAWMSWIDPNTPEADFHVPSSFGRLTIEK